MSIEKINTNILTEEKNKFVKEKENLEEILKEIKINNNDLRDYWQNDTSETTYTKFEKFYVDMEKLISNFNADINYLNNVILPKYDEFEIVTNKTIDNDIAL